MCSRTWVFSVSSIWYFKCEKSFKKIIYLKLISLKFISSSLTFTEQYQFLFRRLNEEMILIYYGVRLKILIVNSIWILAKIWVIFIFFCPPQRLSYPKICEEWLSKCKKVALATSKIKIHPHKQTNKKPFTNSSWVPGVLVCIFFDMFPFFIANCKLDMTE